MICTAEDLSPDQQNAAEILLGHPVERGEAISVRVFEPAKITLERKREIVAELSKYVAEVDAASHPVSDEEAENVITEAMKSGRPGYHPRR